MTFLRAGNHLINMDLVTHVGPGTGGNNATFHYTNGGITPTHMRISEITHCLKYVEAPVADHHIRPPAEPAPTVPEGEEVHEGLEPDDPELEDPEDDPEEDPYDESEENYDPENPEEAPGEDPEEP